MLRIPPRRLRLPGRVFESCIRFQRPRLFIRGDSVADFVRLQVPLTTTRRRTMSGYTVTITPSGDQSGPQTTVQVDTTSGSARVTELTVRAGGNGLSPQELPAIDLALLIAALAPGSAPAITAAPA